MNNFWRQQEKGSEMSAPPSDWPSAVLSFALKLHQSVRTNANGDEKSMTASQPSPLSPGVNTVANVLTPCTAQTQMENIRASAVFADLQRAACFPH